jgi:CheY-like chemotaxis protein/anti-sigma regulatory factor (Ser/Thr protein kinase)
MKLPFSRLVARAVEKMRKRAESKHLALSLVNGETAGFVNADPLKLERVVLNLIQNAVKYTPDGGHVAVTVMRASAADRIDMIVVDDGVGVTAEHLPRLFDRYYRVGELVDGTGLGLSLCKEIIERHGGAIDLQSPPPGKAQGFAATIRLPLTPAPTVLAVDDSRTIQMLLEQQLTAEGYVVVTVGSAEQALALVKAAVPDLLILDSIMPGMDGAELASKLRADRAFRHLPILMITAAELDRAKRDVLEEFRIPILAKPWVKEELIRCIEDAAYGKHYLER